MLQKSKVAGSRIFRENTKRKQSPIRIDAIALSKSPVSLTLGDEVPHIFTRKPRLRPLEILILGAKRLLQHNLPCVDTFDKEVRHFGLNEGCSLCTNLQRHATLGLSASGGPGGGRTKTGHRS